jgi:hypothetical protein
MQLDLVSDALRGIAALSLIPGNGRYAPPTVLGPASNLSCSFRCNHTVIGGTLMQLVVPLLAEALIFSRLSMSRYILREEMVVIFPQRNEVGTIPPTIQKCFIPENISLSLCYICSLKRRKELCTGKQSQFPKQPTITATRQK